jgi:ribonuclease BN (tRNA processing enzyme)
VGLSVTVLGATGSYPGPDGACSGYLVRSGDTSIMVDAGPGTVSNLQAHVGLGDLNAVVLSHCHPDHWTDLLVLRTAWRWGLGREGLRVYGTAENLEMARALTSTSAGRLDPTLDWQVVAGGTEVEVGACRLSFSRTDHYVETLALRVDDREGGSLAYSADTGPEWSFAELGQGIDLGLCESTFEDDQAADGVLHLSARQAGEMARAAGVARLVLTHLLPGADSGAHRRQAEQAFGAPVEIATVHERYDL